MSGAALALATPRPPAADAAAAGGPTGAAAAAAPLVRLEGVAKAFANGVVALDGFELAVREGEFVSLLGPSGCGKSTALRLIAGLAAPSRGRVLRPAARRGEVGFVFQEPTLMPWATAFGNVGLPLRLQGRGRRESRAAVLEALATVGLGGFENAYPRELSGGMRMRVSIARALVTRPRLLLMDEPFAALDEIARLKLNDDLLRLWASEGWTVVFVTHSVYESVYLSTRILVMAARPGRVVAEVDVPAPHPRDEVFRLSPAYAAGCRDASAALRRAMGAAT